MGFDGIYPLVMTNIAVENHHFELVNPLFQWPMSMATLNNQRVTIVIKLEMISRLMFLYILFPINHLFPRCNCKFVDLITDIITYQYRTRNFLQSSYLLNIKYDHSIRLI